MFDLKVISKEKLLFEDAVERVQVEGLGSDYELLSFHADVAGLLGQGRIVIDSQYQVNILKGLVSFHNNRCIILVDEDKKRKRTHRTG